MSTTPVGKALEKVISEVRQAEKLVEDGAPSEDSVLDKIDAVVRILPTLRQAAKESDAAGETLFPGDGLRHVDEGLDPLRFMVDGILQVGEVNKVTKGKANVFSKFHESLLEEDSKQESRGLEQTK